MVMVYILIPVHNNKEDTLNLLACLSKQSYKDITTVIIDDGSTDNTKGDVLASFPDTVILEGDGKLWWTGATVMGVKYVLNRAGDDDYILLLNNDLVVRDDYVETILAAGMSPGAALVGSALVDYDNPGFIESGIRMDRELVLSVNRDAELINNT